MVLNYLFREIFPFSLNRFKGIGGGGGVQTNFFFLICICSKFSLLPSPIFFIYFFKSFSPLKAEATTSSGPTFVAHTEPGVITILVSYQPSTRSSSGNISDFTRDLIGWIDRAAVLPGTRGVRPDAGFEPASKCRIPGTCTTAGHFKNKVIIWHARSCVSDNYFVLKMTHSGASHFQTTFHVTCLKYTESTSKTCFYFTILFTAILYRGNSITIQYDCSILRE